MMTPQEINQYTELNRKFNSECERVCHGLALYDRDYFSMTTFRMEGDGVRCTNAGGDLFMRFDKELLSLTEEELRDYVLKIREDK